MVVRPKNVTQSSVVAKAGRTIVAAALLALAASANVAAQGGPDLATYPLDPPDISSPQSTIETFLVEAAAAIRAQQAGDLAEMEARGDRAFQAMEIERPANDAEFLRAAESALYLFELLARVAPETVDAPDASLAPEELPRLWAIPHTELVLERFDTKTGDPIGYRFTSETIDRLPEFYQRASGLPMKKRFANFAGVAEGFRLRPGFEAPLFVRNAVRRLPPAWFNTFGGEPLWKWIAILVSMLGGLLLAFVLFRVCAPLDDRGQQTSGLRGAVRPFVVAGTVAIIAFVQTVTVDWIRPTGVEREAAVGLLSVLLHLALIWLTFVLSRVLADVVIRLRDMRAYALDAQLVRVVAKLVALLVSVYILVDLTESLGVPVAPVLTGLGVGGLAVALAVRPTLENIIGGFVLFADAPVRVGEFCKFGNELGTVEAIGLRSVRVRGLNRAIITVPNAEFSQLQLINFTRRDKNLLMTRLSLRYETTPDQLRLVLARLRELLIAHPKVAGDSSRVRFVEYGDSALELEVFALVETREWPDFLAIQEDLNLRMKSIVEESGSGFALPSQTIYLEQSEGLDAELTKAAEQEVEQWRSEKRLPFPYLDDKARDELSGTLDYPPDGSSSGTS
jgi:MscS family membrane protein